MTNIDLISDIKYRPSSRQLLVSCWDSSIKLLENDEIKLNFAHTSAVLTSNFINNSTFYFGCLDGNLYAYNLEAQKYQLQWHTSDPISASTYNKQNNLSITASLNGQMAFLDPRQQSPVRTVTSSNKIFDIDTSSNLLVSAMSNRQIAIYDLRHLDKPLQKRESSLKFMTTNVACMPGDVGFVTSSIEGRLAVDYFNPSPEVQANKYAFKSHRQDDTIYPINALAFNPIHNTFATGGSDKTVNLWDPNAKKRIKSYSKFKNSVQSIAFSDDGDQMAVAYSKGPEEAEPAHSSDEIGIEIKDNLLNDAKVSYIWLFK